MRQGLIAKPAPHTLLAAALLLAALLPQAWHAAAQEWKPTRPVELIVGSSAGGGNDAIVRTIQKILQEKKLVDVPVTVVNKPGGGGSIAFAYLNQHAGDGHYICLSPLNLITNHATGLSQFHHREISPLAQIISEYTTVLVRNDSPLRNARDLIERLRQDTQSLTISVGTARGNGPHISLALALKTGGVEVKRLKTVVFQSGGESNTALLGGHIDVVTSSASNAVSAAAVGKLRALAISAPERMGGALASVPTWREQGIDMVFDNWRGIIGSRGLAPAQIAYWEGVFARLAQTEEWKKELAKFQWVNNYMGAGASGRHLDAQYAKIRAALAEIGIAK